MELPKALQELPRVQSGILPRCIWLSLGTGQGGGGDYKNIRGRNATQLECWAGNRIPRVGAGGGACDAELA